MATSSVKENLACSSGNPESESSNPDWSSYASLVFSSDIFWPEGSLSAVDVLAFFTWRWFSITNSSSTSFSTWLTAVSLLVEEGKPFPASLSSFSILFENQSNRSISGADFNFFLPLLRYVFTTDDFPEWNLCPLIILFFALGTSLKHFKVLITFLSRRFCPFLMITPLSNNFFPSSWTEMFFSASAWASLKCRSSKYLLVVLTLHWNWYYKTFFAESDGSVNECNLLCNSFVLIIYPNITWFGSSTLTLVIVTVNSTPKLMLCYILCNSVKEGK